MMQVERTAETKRQRDATAERILALGFLAALGAWLALAASLGTP